MTHTLTAVFDTRGEAQHSLNKLLASGYSHADAALSNAPEAGQVDGNSETATGEHNYVLALPSGHLFARLFGARSDDHRASDAKTSASARHVLTFTTESEAEVKHAAEIVGRLTPVDDEPIYVWRARNSAGATYAVCRPGTEPGALQNSAHGNSHYFGTRDSDDGFQLGTTFKANLSYATRWASIGEHATDAGPLAAQDATGGDGREETSYPLTSMDGEAGYQYRYRRWKAAAASRTANWTLRHPLELRPWRKFTDAVLHGWGRISLDSGDAETGSPPHQLGRHTAVSGSDGWVSAYWYGNEMRHSDRFLGRDWEDVESELHGDWDIRYGKRGLATWNNSKAEVHQGWDRTSA